MLYRSLTGSAWALVFLASCTNGPEAHAPLVGTGGVSSGSLRLIPIDRPVANPGAHLGSELMPDHARGTVKVMAQLGGLGTGDDADVPEGVQLIHVLNGRDPLRTESSTIDLPTQTGHNVLLLCAAGTGSAAYSDPGTFVFTGFNMRGTGSVPEFDLGQQPCLFLLAPSSPDASGAATGPLLDFFVVNCTIAPNGYSVEATIDGTTFSIREWRPFRMEGLGSGAHALRLRLIGPDGQVVNGPFSDTGDRTFRQP